MQRGLCFLIRSNQGVKGWQPQPVKKNQTSSWEPEDIVEDYHNMDTPVEREEDIKRCAKVAVENLYTRNIEKVLQELDGDLRVVHTVHPSEVEQNLEAWIPSMASELKTLEGIGAVKRIRGQAARDYMAQPGVVIVPGKAVYTVKPPSTEGGVCRRKTRIVSCGNFQPKDSSETNYSGGAVAEAVRLGISEASRRRWCACTGDVVSAFLRAPVPQGTCLALRPPMSLIRAGLAERDEVWIVQTALYGFRSSPRWWSNHRTTKMREAVTKGGLTFLQGQADADVWQIRSAQNETVGLMIIYVDDFLILGPKAVCDDAYEWMATTWEATPCQFATPTSSVRFLGMEIRQEVNNEGEITAYTLDQEGYIEEVPTSSRRQADREVTSAGGKGVDVAGSRGLSVNLQPRAAEGGPVYDGGIGLARSALPTGPVIHGEHHGQHDDEGTQCESPPLRGRL